MELLLKYNAKDVSISLSKFLSFENSLLKKVQYEIVVLLKDKIEMYLRYICIKNCLQKYK